MADVQAVRLACKKLRKTLDGPASEMAGEDATWVRLITDLQGDAEGFTPTKVHVKSKPSVDFIMLLIFIFNIIKSTCTAALPFLIVALTALLTAGVSDWSWVVGR